MASKKMKILITDGDTQHSLAVVRSLGKRYYTMVSSNRTVTALSFYSKYCKERIIYPSPKRKDDFIKFMLDIVRTKKVDVLLPLRSTIIPLISEFKDSFSRYVRVPIADYKYLSIASDKKETFKLAEKINVQMPKTLYPKDINEVENLSLNLSYPVVVKASFGAGSRTVWYVNSRDELINLYKKLIAKGFESLPMVQEYILGEGYGFFALFNQGKPRAIFMHHRLREYPITGGPSVVCESIYDEELKTIGLKLLNALNWHGVAMVEFKKDKRDNKYKLIEINPKFWGSLPLAIESGVDFPYLTCKMAIEGDIEPIFNYKIGVKFRWLFPLDVLHLLANPSSVGRFIGDFFDSSMRYSFLMNDPIPNLLEPFLILGYLGLNKGKIKYPQGKPLVK